MDFQDYREAIRHGVDGISFTRTSDERFTLRKPPRVIFGPTPRQFPEWFFGDRGTVECGIVTVERAELFGDRILMRGEVGIYIPQCGVHPHSVAQEAERHAADVAPVRKDFPGEWVLLVGPAYQMYGHWLVDFMPRLVNLVEASRDVATCNYLLPHNLPAFAREWLSIVGVPREKISYYDVKLETCRIERAVVPTGLRGSSRVNPLMAKAVAWIRGRALAGTPVEGRRQRLFVSRRAWGNSSRLLTNEDELAHCAAGFGFEVFNPETLTLTEQVRSFAGAEFVLGDYGSALHSAIFSPAAAMVVALRGVEGHPGFLQSGLCEVLGQESGYVFGETSVSPPNQSYSIAVADLRMCLDLLLSLQLEERVSAASPCR